MSATLSPRFPAIFSALAEDIKGSSVSLCRASSSWGDTEGARDTSGVVEGSRWASEETEGLGVGLEEFVFRGDEGASEDEDESVSKYNTWNHTERRQSDTEGRNWLQNQYFHKGGQTASAGSP